MTVGGIKSATLRIFVVFDDFIETIEIITETNFNLFYVKLFMIVNDLLIDLLGIIIRTNL